MGFFDKIKRFFNKLIGRDVPVQSADNISQEVIRIKAKDMPSVNVNLGGFSSVERKKIEPIEHKGILKPSSEISSKIDVGEKVEVSSSSSPSVVSSEEEKFFPKSGKSLREKLTGKAIKTLSGVALNEKLRFNDGLLTRDFNIQGDSNEINKEVARIMRNKLSEDDPEIMSMLPEIARKLRHRFTCEIHIDFTHVPSGVRYNDFKIVVTRCLPEDIVKHKSAFEIDNYLDQNGELNLGYLNHLVDILKHVSIGVIPMTSKGERLPDNTNDTIVIHSMGFKVTMA